MPNATSSFFVDRDPDRRSQPTRRKIRIPHPTARSSWSASKCKATFSFVLDDVSKSPGERQTRFSSLNLGQAVVHLREARDGPDGESEAEGRNRLRASLLEQLPMETTWAVLVVRVPLHSQVSGAAGGVGGVPK